MARKKTTTIPQDAYAEESVVGTVIENTSCLKYASRLLCPEDFWSEKAAAVFKTCIRLFDGGEKVNKETIINDLREEEEFEDIGGDDYINKLLKSTDDINFASNFSRVKNYSIVREMMNMANSILKDVSGENPDANTILQEAKANIASMEARMNGLPPRITGLEIATTNPRSYRMKLSNGKEVAIGIEDLMSSKKIRQVIVNALDFVPAMPKDWEKFLRQLMQASTMRPASGVDLAHDVLDVIRELFDSRGEATAASDLRTGSYIMDEINDREYYLFQKRPVVEYVSQQLKKDMDSVQLWRVLQQWKSIDNKDGKPIAKRIGNDVRHGLWGLPALIVDAKETEEQKECDFINEDGEIDTSFLD